MSAEPTILPVGAEALLVELGSRQRAAAAFRVARERVERQPVRSARRRSGCDHRAPRRRRGPRVMAGRAHGRGGGGRDAAIRRGGDVSVCRDRRALRRRRPRCCGGGVGVLGGRRRRATCVDDLHRSPSAALRRASATASATHRCRPCRAGPSRVRGCPQGSVALAAEYCGVYPRAMPGGWQLIGTTDAVLFDARRDRPALLAPAASVRFEPLR